MTEEMKATTNLKYRARKLFQQVFQVKYLPAVSTIKLKFPKFDAKSPVHWYNLIDRLNQIIDYSEMTPEEHLKNEVKYFQSIGCFVSSGKSYDGDYEYYISYKGVGMGYIGYSRLFETYYCEFGRQRVRRQAATAEVARKTLIVLNQYNVKLEVA